MRILYLTNGFPYPLMSGYLRHYHFIRELSQRHAITLLSLVNHDFDPANVAAMEPFTERVVTFRREANDNGQIAKMRARWEVLAGEQSAVLAMQRTIEELTLKTRFDVIVLSGKHTLSTLRNRRQLPIVADVCDAASVRVRNRLRLCSLNEKLVVAIRYLILRRLELAVIRRASHSIFASARDRDVLISRDDPNSTVVPNGIDGEYWRRRRSERGRNRVVFSGAMHYPPNADCCLYLIRKIWPIVQRAIPDAKLDLVGRDPTPELVSAAAGVPNVRLTGLVPDVRPFLDEAAVFAAPLRFAAGIQNKVLEAMAMELPVVASPAAAGGLLIPGLRTIPIDITSGTAAFAERIVARLREAEHQRAPLREAREYVLRHFDWNASGELLERVLLEAAGVQSPQTTISQREALITSIEDSLPVPAATIS